VGSDESSGTRLAVSLAKVAFVHTRRMFDVVLGADPPAKPGGFPLRTVPEAAEFLLKPKMYYELQRGSKKLKF